MNKVNYLSCLLFLFLFTMCKENKDNASTSAEKVLFPLEETILTHDLKPYVEKMEFIEIMETPETMLSDIGRMVIDQSGNMFIGLPIVAMMGGERMISTTLEGLAALKPDGTLLRRIAEKGNGHREYSSIYDYCLSEDGEELMILDHAKIRCYGIKDSNSFRVINCPITEPIDAIAPAKDKGAYLFSAYFNFSKDEINPDKKEFLVKRVDKDGQITGEYIPKDDFTITTGNISQVGNNRYYLRPQNNQHIVYELTSDTLLPLYQIDFKEETIPAKYFYDHAGQNIRKYMSAPYYKMPIYFKETKENLFFKVAASEANEANFVYSTSKNKGVHWMSSQDDPHIQILASDDDYFYTSIFNHDIEKYKVDNPDTHGALFRVIAETIIKKGAINNDNSNPIIVKIKFKI